MQGRITEAQLPLAERTFPGITAMYAELRDKPVTFLQLVWMYEDLCACGGELELGAASGYRQG